MVITFLLYSKKNNMVIIFWFYHGDHFLYSHLRHSGLRALGFEGFSVWGLYALRALGFKGSRVWGLKVLWKNALNIGVALATPLTHSLCTLMIVVMEVVVVAAAAYLEKRDIMNSKGFKSILVFRLLLKHDLVIQYWKTFLIIIFLKTSLVVLSTYSMISKKNCQDEKNLENFIAFIYSAHVWDLLRKFFLVLLLLIAIFL